MLIKDLVHIDEHGAFRSDVQLSDYDNPKLNLDLLRNYIFTVSAPATSRAGRDMSAKDVLDMLKTAFTLERFENRMVLTANYGRGKSHLALTLANFFARPADSEEVRIIFDRLGQALNNPAMLKGYQEFKQSKGEFLVIRLRGDDFDDLQEGFLRALEQALSEHDCTRGMELPFWYTHAQQWLDSLSGENRQKAETFLAGHNTDLATLRQDLRKNGAYELVQETVKHLTGFYPDFGREVSLKDLVLWAVDEVCMPKKMGGLLILFDEFSLFLQKYAVSRTAGKLQDLLNGISDRQGKSVFLAFTQIELESVLETYTQGTRRDDVKKELDRLPQDKRARLFSLMESVLDSYLKQDEAAWKDWLQRRPIRAAMTRNRETLTDYFSQRYNETLRWDTTEQEKTIVKGCFPLHPLTTAILSNHTFEAGAGENARTALHFVRDRWEKGLPEKPAEREDGTPNFVFAIELVDFFGEQISKKWYEAYHAALENARIPLNEEHRAALKALLLQQAVSALDRKKVSGSEQLTLLSALSGLSEYHLKTILRELGDNRVIEFDPYRKVSSLLPAGARSLEADKIIEDAVQKIPIDLALLDEIGKAIPQLTVPQSFGHADDWAPRQVVLTEEFFTAETLKNLLLPYRAGTDGIEEGARGLVIWLLAQTEEEKMHLRQNAQKILDEVLGASTHPLPIVIILPNQPNPGLIHAARRKKALENLGRTEREKISDYAYKIEKDRAEGDLDLYLKIFLGDDQKLFDSIPRQAHSYALPRAYLSHVQTTNKHLSIQNVLKECYSLAYTHRVEFYTQYGLSSSNLRKAIKNLVRALLGNEVANSIRLSEKKDIGYQLPVFYLNQKWGLLSAETYVIQPPHSLALRESWNRLEATFQPGCKETRTRDVLLELLNPPYGHDYNTLTLLLAAWMGHRRHEIRISLGGQLVSMEAFKNHFDQTKSPKDFLDRLLVTSPLAISRINANEMFAEVDSILEQIRQNHPFSLTQAQQALAKLEQAQENINLPPDRREAITALKPYLQEAIEQAKTYDEQVTGWMNALPNIDFDQLFALRAQLDEFILPALVSASQPTKTLLLKEWESYLEQETKTYCRRYAQLQDLSEYKAHEEQLNKALRKLKEYPALCSIVENALKELTQRRNELKQAESEKSIIAEINGMAASAGLADLYRYQARLAQFKNLSPKTEKLRQDKVVEIENRIQQFEQLAELLSQTIETADSLEIIHQQQNVLLRNIDQVQGTPLYQSLTVLEETIEQLLTFFEQLREIDKMPNNSPKELDAVEAQLAYLETQFSPWLSPAQARLLTHRKQQLADIRKQREQEANQWLINLANRYKTGAKPDELLRLAQTPHPFLSEEDTSKLEQLKRVLQKAIKQDRLHQIESLFVELDSQSRRECLIRLQALVDKQ